MYLFRVAAVLVAVAGLASSCGGGDTTVTETVTVPASAEEGSETSPEAAEPETGDEPESGLGQSAQSGGIKLTVTKASASETLQYIDDFGATKTKPAKQGGRYVSVKTRLTNDTEKGIDLTCSFPVDAKLVDDAERQFDPVDNLYQLPGNPECNELTQPGFKTSMTWTFLVPEDAEISTFQFAEVPQDFDAPQPDPAEIALPDDL